MGDNSQKPQPVSMAVADPSALGLFGLAIVTLVASSQKLGITSDVSYVVPWAIFLGAIAQLFASSADSKLQNVFGCTAFGAYGLFWLGVALSWLIKFGVFGEAMRDAADPKQLGFAYLGYLIFTLIMTYGAASTHKVLFTIFVLIDFLFIGLCMNTLGFLPDLGHHIAGISELLISLFSFYGFGAAVLNAHYKRTILPVGKPLIKR